ncbi:MAG: hypothetical protein P8Z35_26390, partial [Ignavibacteriaceae bacterium]
MGKLENYNQLLNMLQYGRQNTVNVNHFMDKFDATNLIEFKLKVRELAQEARFNGHWLIGENNGYYLALT